ncbi:MAG: hypothetical protein GY699_13220 [Desulfobacteraceae bacterium]|nr:hypothetical protein [Desulfobacteraceae bacterium]
MKFEYKIYLEYAITEATSFQVYVSAVVIGTIICFFTSNYSIVPFIVPLFIQILVKSNARFCNRHQNALVELPAQTEDPVFIMDIQGNIILSTGKTLDIFNTFSIRNIKDIIDETAFDDIINIVSSQDPVYASNASVEVFSDKTLKWYEIKAKATGMKYGDKALKILVWFQDISLRKIYHLRLRDLLRYSDSLIVSLESPVKSGTEYEHLPAFLLKEYEAVFITRANRENNLEGYVFKNSSQQIIKSEAITINKESLAPINISRKREQIISNDISSYNSEKDFLQDNPLDPAVLDFIDVPIQNFITFNEADISIIAFNFKSRITAYEKQFFEIVVNIYRTMVKLVDLKKELQKYTK